MNGLDETALAAAIGTSIGTQGTVPQQIAITDDGNGAPLVGGFAVTYIGQVGTTGSQVYSIAGVLPSAEAAP